MLLFLLLFRHRFFFFSIEGTFFEATLTVLVLFGQHLDLARTNKDALARVYLEVALTLYATIVLASRDARVQADPDPESSSKGRLADEEDGAGTHPCHFDARMEAYGCWSGHGGGGRGALSKNMLGRAEGQPPWALQPRFSELVYAVSLRSL